MYEHKGENTAWRAERELLSLIRFYHMFWLSIHTQTSRSICNEIRASRCLAFSCQRHFVCVSDIKFSELRLCVKYDHSVFANRFQPIILPSDNQDRTFCKKVANFNVRCVGFRKTRFVANPSGQRRVSLESRRLTRLGKWHWEYLMNASSISPCPAPVPFYPFFQDHASKVISSWGFVDAALRSRPSKTNDALALRPR